MNYPIKPWEMATTTATPGLPYVPNTDRLHSTAIPFPGSGGGGSGSAAVTNNPTAPPPLPPRPEQTRPIYSAYNRSSMMPYSYSSPYSGYGGYSPYSPYNSYGSYSGGGYGYGYGSSPYYNQHGPGGELSFSQLAEESSASAFQSIESFVGAFSSISMMLESTFHALHSSFRAVVGVADQLGRVKQVFSALAIFRFFKWMLRRLMYLIGLTKMKPETVESLWKESINANLQANGLEDAKDFFSRGEPSRPSSWPILVFLGFICGGPYLMWKLVKSLNLDGSQSAEHHKAWASGEIEHFIAEVKFSFDAGSERELNVKPGQTIRLAPAKFQPNNVRGWALASDGTKIGLVPLNYIKVLGKRSGSGPEFSSSRILNNMNETCTPTPPTNEDPFSDHVPQVLTPSSRPRVRFDLNPRPAESENSASISSNKTDHELTGILVKNENTPAAPPLQQSANENVNE